MSHPIGRPIGRRSIPALCLAAAAAVLAACSGPILANPPVARPEITPAPSATQRPPDPQPVVLPADDAPHDRLTEWWYYTGHLRDETGGRWGFEFVVFRAERGEFPVTWASHLALTDETGGRFHYAERAEIGPQVNLARAGAPGFALGVRGPDLADSATFARAPWTMTGIDGTDHLVAAAGEAEAAGDPVGGPSGDSSSNPSGGFGLDLAVRATKPAALHDRDGYIDFGPAGGSYYYSRTAMTAAGTITVGDRTLAVNGTAWFDHQWGDFISVGAGGWDWFAINLDDGTDVTVSLVRAADGSHPLVYGTLVDAEGGTRHLGADDVTVEVTGDWTSPATGVTWPAGWTVTLPGEDLVVTLDPSVPQQELDTRATTGVVYWEGSQRVSAVRAGRTLGGKAYVELTGYAAGR